MSIVRVEEMPVQSDVKFFKYCVEGLPQDSGFYGGERIGVMRDLYRLIEESGAMEILDMHPDASVNHALKSYAEQRGITYRNSATAASEQDENSTRTPVGGSEDKKLP